MKSFSVNQPRGILVFDAFDYYHLSFVLASNYFDQGLER
jgi:hypothetical protein